MGLAGPRALHDPKEPEARGRGSRPLLCRRGARARRAAAPGSRTRGRSAGRRWARGRDLPGGACQPRGSHPRRRPARGLDEGAGRRTRAPRCRREAAPVVTGATRKWRRELARASRGLEEPRPRGPARRHTARSRDGPSRSPSSESRYGVVEGACGSTRSLGRLFTDACRGPRGPRPGSPRKTAGTRASPRHRFTAPAAAAAAAHLGSPGRPVPAALAAHRKRPGA